MGWAARFLTAVSFLAAGILFAPDALLGGSPGRPAAGVAAARLAHLLCFATAWGAALWVTFIGGIVMFKNLPRHQFGNLQGKMFPAYFMLISVCSAISVAAFAYLHPWKTASTIERYQLGFLLAALGFNLSNLLVFTPMTIEMMMKRHKIEKDLGIGSEEAQDREGPRHRQRGGGFEEFRRCEDESRACGDEQEVWDDPRAVVAGKHHGVRQPCHALLASRQQAQALTG